MKKLFILALVMPVVMQAQISWQRLNGPHGASGCQLHTIDTAGQLFLTVSDSIYISADKGTSWRLANTGISADDLLDVKFITRFPSGKIIARAADSYYRYQPADDSWQLLSTDDYKARGTLLSFDTTGVLWFVLADYHFLCVSHDEGATYEIVSFSISGLRSFCAFDADWNLALINYSVSRYYETGIGPSYGLFFSATSVMINPYSGVAFVNSPQTSKRSDNLGASWTPFEIDTVLTTNYLENMVFVSENEIWAKGYYHLFRSLDGGVSWEKIQDDFNYPNNLKGGPDGSLYLQHSCSSSTLLGRSDDGAQSWTEIAGGFNAPNIDQIQVTEYGRIYTETCEQYQGSKDGGLTWNNIILTDSNSIRMKFLAAHPDGTLFGISDKARVMKSLDDGLSWTPTAQPDAGAPLVYSDIVVLEKDFYNNLVLCTKKGSFTSTDKGQSWKKIGLVNLPNNNYGTDIVFGPEGNVYTRYIWFYPDRYIRFYNAQTDTMEEVSFPEVPGFSDMVFSYAQAFITPTGDFYCYGYAENLHKSLLLKKLPNQFAFEHVASFVFDKILGMAASASGEVFVATQSGIYSSVNGGLSWNDLGGHAAPIHDFVANVDIFRYHLQVGADQYLYESYYGCPLASSKLPLATKNIITGQVFQDKNDNCLRDPDELPVANIPVRTTGAYGLTNAAGVYSLTVPAGTYSLRAYPPGPLQASCDAVTVSFPSNTDTAIVDLGLRKTADCHYLRADISHPTLRPCRSSRYIIAYQNIGTITAHDATVTVTLDSLLIFLYAELPVYQQNGNSYTFLLGDVAPGQSGQIFVQVKVDCSAQAGELVCLGVLLAPENDCIQILSKVNEDQDCQSVVTSFDPNDKRAFVDGIEALHYIKPGKALEYCIRFQNTGTDTAFNVVIKDRISEKFDLSTLSNVLASHPYEVHIGDDRVVEFIFRDILLPDSNVNEPASHGFVQFTIQPKENTPLSTELSNSADIYFDYNAPVATNESKLSVSLLSTTTEARSDYRISAFPNPFGQNIRLQIQGSGARGGQHQALVFDALGRLVTRQSFSGDSTVLDAQDWPPGVYYVEMRAKNGPVIGRLKIVRVH